MPFREKGLNERVFSQSVPLSRPAPVQTGAKVRGFSPTGLEFTAETDSLLEETVTSEPVSEMGFLGPANYGPILRRLWMILGA